jgi:hypothetical protein|tara:strand:- start:221 stop:427 length:207 start_codon:yes stop_codon:yes gene_type:complete
MMVFTYDSKKALRAAVGKPLAYIETSLFGPEYVSNGTITGANRPHITGSGREFFAVVTMQDDVIVGVK